jgi:hypothetical chaperone protein
LSQYIYGLDFGTSNSVLAILNTSSREIVKVFAESSLIYFQDAQNCYLGSKAIQKYIENNMSGRLLKSIKTLLPQSRFTFTYIYGKKYTAEDLVVLILKHLKSQADEFIGENITTVVMGRPVVFSEDPEEDRLAEKRLLIAARKAGFENIAFQYEPIAAGFLYEQSINKPETVLIGDFGGGTSDFTLMKLDKNKMKNGDRKSDIIHTGGIHIGGDDFDAQIMWNKLVPYFGYGLKYDSMGKMLDLPVHIFRTLCEWEQMAFLKEGKIRRKLDEYHRYTNYNPAINRLIFFIDNNLGFSMFQDIEKAKIELSSESIAEIIYQRSLIDINVKVALEEFNLFIEKELSKIDSFITTFLEEANIKPEDVDNVFLTGGTSSIGAVIDIFNRKFSREKIHSGDNFNSVALGLALSYYY